MMQPVKEGGAFLNTDLAAIFIDTQSQQAFT